MEERGASPTWTTRRASPPRRWSHSSVILPRSRRTPSHNSLQPRYSATQYISPKQYVPPVLTLQSNNPSALADLGSPTEAATPTPSPPSPAPAPPSPTPQWNEPQPQWNEPQPQWNEPQSQPFPDSQKSFSEFLDYGFCASQQSEHGVAVPAPKSTSNPNPNPTPQTPTSAPAANSHAQLLRTRLTFAKYKVNTNQVSKPSREILSDFELSSSPDMLRTSNDAYLTSAEHLAPAATQRVPDITISSPSRHPVFVKANLDPFRPIGALGQPPVSFAPPTQNSAIEQRVVEGYDVRSSPPVQSVSPAALMSPAHGEESKHERLQRLKGQQWRENSSATETAGSAAKGLMELMSGRR